MAPQSIQIVVSTRFFRKHVDQVVAVIRQDPFRVLEAFHANRIFAALGELLADFFRNRLNLLRIGAGTHDEEIREGRHVAQVQDLNILSFFRFSGPDRGEPMRGFVLYVDRLRGGIALLSNAG
jgi:hypothetical protein